MGELWRGALLSHCSPDESQQTSLQVFALYSFGKSRTVSNICVPWQIQCYANWSTSLKTESLVCDFRDLEVECIQGGLIYPQIIPQLTKRNVHISKGLLLLSGQVWSFQYAPQCCAQRSSQCLSGFKQRSLPYSPVISFSHETSDPGKEFTSIYSYNETFFYLITYLRYY